MNETHLLQNIEVNDDSVGLWECSCGAWERSYPAKGGTSTTRDSWLAHVAGTRPKQPDLFDKLVQALVLLVIFAVGIGIIVAISVGVIALVR